MDYSAVKELIGIIDSSSLTEFQLTMDNVSVSMSKLNKSSGDLSFTKQQENVSSTANISKNNATSYASDTGASPTATSIAEPAASVTPAGELVKAPIVGTYYASSGAGKENFVKCGDKVKAGDTLCILEAMKIMNEIVSPCDGEVVEIYAKNEALVEYGQALFRIMS